VWFRYVDDTFVLIQEDEIERFTAHINQISAHIKFTHKLETDNQLSLLDSLVHLHPDSGLKTTVFQKKTHTDQYLNFKSNHHLAHKCSVPRTLLHRVQTIVLDPENQTLETSHIHKALADNDYPNWMF
jgi:hypothetical protein